jgi:parvulin-like peptidyl-prolyl isomerase
MAFQLEAEYTPNVTISRFDEDLDAAVLDAIFRSKKPALGKGRLGSTISTTGDYVVFMVSAVIPGRPETVPLEERDRRKEELQMTAGAMDFNAYINDLVRTADIERSEDALAEPEFLQ